MCRNDERAKTKLGRPNDDHVLPRQETRTRFSRPKKWLLRRQTTRENPNRQQRRRQQEQGMEQREHGINSTASFINGWAQKNQKPKKAIRSQSFWRGGARNGGSELWLAVDEKEKNYKRASSGQIRPGPMPGMIFTRSRGKHKWHWYQVL